MLELGELPHTSLPFHKLVSLIRMPSMSSLEFPFLSLLCALALVAGFFPEAVIFSCPQSYLQ